MRFAEIVDAMESVVDAAEEMLKFGEHDGECKQGDDLAFDGCGEHRVSFAARRLLLTNALVELKRRSDGK